MYIHLCKVLVVPLVVGVMLGISGCDWVDEEGTGHTEAYGVRLMVGGETIVTVQEANVSGRFAVVAGAELGPVVAQFLDEAGRPIPSEELEEDLAIGWAVNNVATATLASDPADAWAFRVRGVQAGNTAVVIGLKHGDHFDFRTPEIGIEVLP